MVFTVAASALVEFIYFIRYSHLTELSFLVQEHRTEIDARAGTFQAFELFGHQLLQSGHFASAEVQEKLDAMNEDRQDLERWVK